jgi:hypothetical protein
MKIVTGPPAREDEAAYRRFGRYGQVEVWALKDGSAVTCYRPTLTYFKWENRLHALRYALRMARQE